MMQYLIVGELFALFGLWTGASVPRNGGLSAYLVVSIFVLLWPIILLFVLVEIAQEPRH